MEVLRDRWQGRVMDYPAAWAFVRETNPTDHHERCSWRRTNGALLCDCDVIWDEYVRRGGEDRRSTESPDLPATSATTPLAPPESVSGPAALAGVETGQPS